RTEFGDEAELTDWVELLGQRVDISALYYDAILTAMYALPTSADRTCYLCVPPDPGIEPAALGAGEAAALGASASPALGAGESALLGTAPAEALYTFTLDSSASRSFFRDSTTLTPLSRLVLVSLVDPSGGPVLAHSSTVLPCPAVPSGSLSGLHLPSFSTNLVSGADLQDQWVDQFTPGGQRVTHCTCSRTGRHLATFTHAPGSSLYTLTTVSPQVVASVSASGQLAPPCSCCALSHQTLLWHHCLGHPSVQRLHSMHHRVLVSSLPRVLPPLPPSPAPPCLPCVEGRQRAAPHSSSFPPTEAPLADSPPGRGKVPDILIPWIRAARLQLRERFGTEFPVLRLHSDRGGEFSSNLLAAFCPEHGIRQTFTLPASQQQNGVAEHRIGLVMEVAFTSMIHAAAPHFLWPFAVRYAAHQLNLWPRVSLPETSPTLLRTGKVGGASRFRVWGARAFVYDTTMDKLSARTVPCVFLGFVPDAPGWQFYHPTSRCVFPSQDVTFDESVPFYRVSQVDPPPLTLPVEVTGDSGPAEGGPARGASSGGAEPGGAEPGGAEPGDAEPGREESRGAEPGGAAPGGAEASGEQSPWSGCLRSRSAGTSPLHSRRQLPFSPQQLREWYVGRQGRTAGARGLAAGGAGAGDSATGVVSAGGSTPWVVSAEPGGTEPGRSAGTSPLHSRRRLPLSPQQLREWYVGRQGRTAGARGLAAGGAGAGDSATGVVSAGGSRAAEGAGARGCRAAEGAGAGGSGAAAGADTEGSDFAAGGTCADVTRAGSGAGPRGARTGGTGAAGAGGDELEGAAAGDTEAGDPGTGGAGSGGAAAGGAGPGGAAAEGSGAAGGTGNAGGAGAAGAGSTAQPRLFFAPPSPSSQPPSDSVLCQVLSLPSSTGLPLQPGSPLPAPSPYTEQTGGLTERREPASRPVSPVHSGRSGRRVPCSCQPAVPITHLVVRRPSSPPQSVPLPSPPASSLPTIPEPESDRARAAHPTVTRLLATVVTDPSFESTAAFALVAELVDFAAACRLDYAASLAAESESDCPPSVGGECALGTDVLEDMQEDLECLAAAAPHLVSMLLAHEGDPDAPDIPTPRSYAEAITVPYSSQWQTAMDAEMASGKSTGTYIDKVPPLGANIVCGMWIFRVKRPPEGVDFFQTFSSTPKMTTLRVLLHVATQRDYELHSLDFSTAFLQGSLHEEIWLRRPSGFTGSFPPGTQWSLRQPVYGLRQAPRECYDTLRTTLAAFGFAPSTADPSLFLRTDTSLPPFYILVYVDDLVFATADTKALALVKSELQKRHTCTDLGELRSYLGLQITRDRARRTITLTQSHMVQQVLQCFAFTWSSAQATPLATSHSLSAPPSDESIEPSGPYPELVGCLITSGMGLVLGGRGDVVLTGHSDASWVDDQATQRSSQGYTFSLGSGSVSWRSTRSSSVLSSSCEAEIYATAMAAQELRWLTYMLTDLGERPRSPPVLYVDNKATIALCQEHRLEHRTKHIALRYFLARELQQRSQLRLAHVATRANTADIFTKALPSGDHQLRAKLVRAIVLPSLSPCVSFPPMGSDGCFQARSGSEEGLGMGVLSPAAVGMAASLLKPCSSSSSKGDVVAGVERMVVSEKGKEEVGARSGEEEVGRAKWPENGVAGLEKVIAGVENGATAAKNGFVHPHACTNPSSAASGCAYNEPKVQPLTAAPGSHCECVVPRMIPLKLDKPVACVLGIGTANPDTIRPQGQFAKEYLSRVGCHHAETQAKFERICESVGRWHMILVWSEMEGWVVAIEWSYKICMLHSKPAVSLSVLSALCLPFALCSLCLLLPPLPLFFPPGYHTGIDKRHMVLPWDTIAANPCLQEFGAPSLAMRQDILRTEGVKLAAAACERALAEWGGDRAGVGGVGGVGGAGGEGGGAGGITHLVVVTVSGVHLPGLDVQLVEALGLRRSTQRVLLQMLGCYAGVTALRIAKDLAENNADEGARVLLVCSELNSLIFQAPHESLPDSLVCAAIFGDGAAAMVVGANPRTHASHTAHTAHTAPAAPAAPSLHEATTSPQQQQQQQGTPPPSLSPPAGLSPEKPIFEIVRVAEFFLPETTRHIAGDLTEAGLLVHLRREVPLLLPGPVKDFSAALLGLAGVGFAESFWAVHPGGRAILDAIQRNLGLKKHALKASREVLRQYGNMSSGQDATDAGMAVVSRSACVAVRHGCIESSSSRWLVESVQAHPIRREKRISCVARRTIAVAATPSPDNGMDTSALPAPSPAVSEPAGLLNKSVSLSTTSQAAPSITATLAPFSDNVNVPVDVSVAADGTSFTAPSGDASVSLMSSSAAPSFAEAPSPYELSSLEAALEQHPAILVVVASALVLIYLVAGELSRSRGW
ncbi:unnamed protein product, partial [Closterium sp. NIES-53]